MEQVLIHIAEIVGRGVFGFAVCVVMLLFLKARRERRI